MYSSQGERADDDAPTATTIISNELIGYCYTQPTAPTQAKAADTAKRWARRAAEEEEAAAAKVAAEAAAGVGPQGASHGTARTTAAIWAGEARMRSS